MKTYLANSLMVEGEESDIYLCVEYLAESDEEAEAIAVECGWDYLGEKVGEVECDDEIVAMIEKQVRNETVH